MPTFVVCSPTHVCDLRMVVAAMRAGELGLFDLGYAGDIERHRPALRRLAEQTGRYEGTWGGRWDVLGREDRSPRRLAGLIEQRWPHLLLAGLPHDAAA